MRPKLLEEYGLAEPPRFEKNGEAEIELPPIDHAPDLIADESIILPPQIIEGVLHQGLKAVLGSSSKARKTWILLDAAISVATGTHFWRWKTHKGKVLYINFEIPRPFMRSRIVRICEAKQVSDLSNLDVWTLRGKATALGKLLPALLGKIETSDYVLICIDPIYKSLGGRDENSAGDIGELCNEIERLAVATRGAVLYAAHFSKGSQAGKEAIDRIGGSGVFTRDADSIIILTPLKTDGAYAVELILRNLPEHPSFAIKWAFPLMVETDLDPTDLKPARGRKKEYDPLKLLAAIEETNSKRPMSITRWAAVAGVPRQSLCEYLPEMRNHGWIKTTGEGTTARQYITKEGRLALKNENKPSE